METIWLFVDVNKFSRLWLRAWFICKFSSHSKWVGSQPCAAFRYDRYIKDLPISLKQTKFSLQQKMIFFVCMRNASVLSLSVRLHITQSPFFALSCIGAYAVIMYNISTSSVWSTMKENSKTNEKLIERHNNFLSVWFSSLVQWKEKA